jgi:catechol 2,3-dioxygenase-like lactoylglutathione lyase family enzyme
VSDTPRVTGIGGVFFKARDQQALGDWYRRHLGIDVQDGGWAVFRWRDHEDASRPGSTVWSVFPESTEYFGAAEQRAMINYRVGDLDAVLAALRGEGVRVDDEIQESPEGRFCWITDPEETGSSSGSRLSDARAP